VNLNQPVSITNVDGEELKTFQFWDTGSLTIHVQKETDSITINGVSETSAFTTMQDIDWIMDSGDEVTISGLDNTLLNTTYQIESFNYSVESGTPSVTFWDITLEMT
jgi:hypothetical protein